MSISAFAQWSNDPSENTAISFASGEQAIPKVATSENGTTYISWFSNESGNYNVMLQKLDVFGNFQWDSAGLLVSDHPAMTWLTEWDMTIDQEDFAILTFQDIRNVNNDVFAYRISPDGEFVWGEDGIEISTGPAFDVTPKVTVTNAGNAVFAWQAEDVVIIQKISPGGSKLWGDNGITLSGSNTYSWPQLLPVGDDDIILKYFDDSGLPNAPTRHVYTQRYDSDGNPVWTAPTIISNAAGISAWTNTFPFINDGNDGFYIAWHDDRDMNNQSSIYVHHIGSDGSAIFADDGVEATNVTYMNHFDANLALPPDSEDIFIFWLETNLAQSSWGIYGQKLSSTGQRLWTDNGKSFIDVSATNVIPIAARNSDEDMIVLYEEHSNVMNAGIKAMRIETDGNFVWENEKIEMCSVQSEKVHTVANSFFNNQWIASWEDSRNGGKDIYAQNIQIDGSLGPVTAGEIEIFPDTLYFEENPQTQQIYIVNNTLDVYIINNIDESGELFWIVDPYPLLPYELMVGDSLILNVYFECWIDSHVYEYLYEPLNIISETDTHTVIIGINEDIMIGYYDFRNDLLQVYPNPAKDFIIFTSESGQVLNYELFIFDSFGKKIKTFRTEANKTTFWDLTSENGRKVKPGTYYYRLISDMHQESGKIILLD